MKGERKNALWAKPKSVAKKKQVEMSSNNLLHPLYSDLTQDSTPKLCESCSKTTQMYTSNPLKFGSAYCNEHNKEFNARHRIKYQVPPRGFPYIYHARLSFSDVHRSPELTKTFDGFRQMLPSPHKYVKRIHFVRAYASGKESKPHLHLQCLFLFKSAVDCELYKKKWLDYHWKLFGCPCFWDCYFEPIRENWETNLLYILPKHGDKWKQQLPPRGMYPKLVSGSRNW